MEYRRASPVHYFSRTIRNNFQCACELHKTGPKVNDAKLQIRIGFNEENVKKKMIYHDFLNCSYILFICTSRITNKQKLEV